ncbi:unnamed protein product [Coccothraustes coccothraustes]
MPVLFHPRQLTRCARQRSPQPDLYPGRLPLRAVGDPRIPRGRGDSAAKSPRGVPPQHPRTAVLHARIRGLGVFSMSPEVDFSWCFPAFQGPCEELERPLVQS